MVLIAMGRLREAEEFARRGIEMADQHGPDETRAWAYGFGSWVDHAKGDGSGDLACAARVQSGG
jgi:hypothetical protein